jgi:hypothetical protein
MLLVKQKIFFSNDSTGTSQSLSIEDGKISRATEPGSEHWVYGSARIHPRSLEDVLPAFGMEPPELIPAPIQKSFIHTRLGNIDWSVAMGAHRFARQLKQTYLTLCEKLNSIEDDPYLPTLLSGRKILSRLEPSSIDVSEYRRLKEEGNHPQADTFEPDEHGFSKRIRYSHDTSTGRLKVSEGPKILSLPKGDRKIIKSRWEGGQVFMIDFVSLEPRVMLLLTRDDAPRDIYEAMREELNLPDATRAKLKLATISTLYGSKSQDPSLVVAVNKFFRVSEVGRRHLSGEDVCNLYGRRLNPEEANLRLSHFVQSTAVDVALMGFEKIFSELPGGCIPSFLIHDALLVDVPPESIKEFPTEVSVEIEPLGTFYVSSKPLSGDI